MNWQPRMPIRTRSPFPLPSSLIGVFLAQGGGVVAQRAGLPMDRLPNGDGSLIGRLTDLASF
jgi:hypothetical protein